MLVDRFNDDGHFSSVSVDSIAGIRRATEHLIETGRRRIAFVGGPSDMRQAIDRLARARVAVDASEHAVELEVIATDALSIEAGANAGRRIMQSMRRERPDGIFAANDLVALGLLQSLVDPGVLLLPQTIALIGFDDIVFAASAAVPLSSMRQPSRAIGQTAVRMLLEQTDDPDLVPRQTVSKPELIVRTSTPLASR